MQKIKTARVANKGKISSAGKTGKTMQTKTRKPLTAAQREHKREHDRLYRRKKAETAKAAANKQSVTKKPEIRKGQVYSLERALPLGGSLPVPVGTVFTVGEHLDSVETFDFGIGGTCRIPSAWIKAAFRAGCLYLVDDPNSEAVSDPQRRAVAGAKADAAEKGRAKKGCRRTGEACAHETPCNAGDTGCSTKGTCGDCGPNCCNYEKCHHLARTEGFPRLHQAKDAVEAANREAAAHPTRHVLAVEPVKGQTSPLPANPIEAIGEWVRTNLDRLEATKGTGIVRQTFTLPDGVAEVSVSRKVCELPPRLPAPHGWFASGVLDALVRAFGRPVAVAVPVRCGLDFGHPAELDRVWDGVSAAVDRDWAAIKAGSAE